VSEAQWAELMRKWVVHELIVKTDRVREPISRCASIASSSELKRALQKQQARRSAPHRPASDAKPASGKKRVRVAGQRTGTISAEATRGSESPGDASAGDRLR
jgi:hypothetical protein